jgi:hypothetical protein
MKTRRMLFAVLWASASLSHRAGAADIWTDTMETGAAWQSYRAGLVPGPSNGTCSLSLGNELWGQVSAFAGTFDIGQFRYLKIKVDALPEGRMKIALADATGKNFQEIASIDDPGSYVFNMRKWVGNHDGSEDVKLYLVLERRGALCVIDQVMISDTRTAIPSTLAFAENMNDVAEWGPYQADYARAGAGLTTLVSTNMWGKMWTLGGTFDTSIYRHLRLVVAQTDLRKGSMFIALSGPHDANYQNLATIRESGTYTVDISAWKGNAPGPEKVFVQLVVEGRGARASFDDLTITAFPLP